MIARPSHRRSGPRRLTRPVLAALCVLAGIARPAAAEPWTDGELIVTLTGALPVRSHDAGKQLRHHDLELTLTIHDGKLQPRVWAWTPFAPGQEHLGALTTHTVDRDALRFEARLPVNHQRTRPAMLGGLATLRVELRRQDDGWSGSFSGSMLDANHPDIPRRLEPEFESELRSDEPELSQPPAVKRLDAAVVSGEVNGVARARHAPAPARLTGHAPPAPGEHPRLLFRKSDLPSLRERMNRPETARILAALQEMLERAERGGFAFRGDAAEHTQYGIWAAGHGLMYQLTGDKTHAEKAMRLGVAALYTPYYYGGWWIHSFQVMGMALAYDMCYDAWPEPYRAMIYAFLYQNARDMAMRHEDDDPLGVRRVYGFANDQQNFRFESVRSFEPTKKRFAAAIAALAIAGDPVPIYKPSPLDSVRVIEPAADYQPWIGTPVVSFSSERMPADWLVNGPFRRGLAGDPLAEIGGLANARPEEGTPVTHDGVKLDFRRYRPSGAEDVIGGPRIYPRSCGRYWTSATGGGYYPGIRLAAQWREQLGRRPGMDVTIYTVLDNDRERVVQAKPNWGWNSYGIRMWLNGVEVSDGDLVRLKPGLYPMMCHVPLMSAYANQGPRLREYTARDYAADIEAWRRAQTAFSPGNGSPGEIERNLEALVRAARRYIADQIGPQGSGGWNNAMYETMLPFLLMYRNVTGADLAAGTGVQQIMPMAARARSARLRGRRADLVFPHMVSQSLALMPDAHKPVAMWYIQQEGLALRRPHECAIGFVTWPMDVAPRHPSELFALPAMCPGHGLHLFPGGWDGVNGFLVQAEHAAAPMASPFGFGNIAITGLGQVWAPMRPKSHRWEEQFTLNKVSVHDHFHRGGGRVVYSDRPQDGSGVISIVADAFDKGAVLTGDGRPRLVLDPDAAPRVSMLRSVAVDYSGRSGAPALVVIADRISGLTALSEKVWRMDLGPVFERFTLNTETRSFGVGPVTGKNAPADGPNPSLAATVVWPQIVDLKIERYDYGKGVIVLAQVDRRVTDRERAEKGYQKQLEEKMKTGKGRSPNGLRTDDILFEFDKNLDQEDRAARAEDVVYLVVITVQDGKPPEVQSDGPGANARVSVGARVLRFDGEKIVFEK
jgi:hypothetical protein